VSAVQVRPNDGKEWSETDIRDLKASIEYGASIEDTADHLCRQVEAVAGKAEQLGLDYHSEPPKAPALTHKITKAEVVEDDGGFGVYFEFDDGESGIIDASSRKEAEFYSRDRVGDDIPVGSHPFLLPAEKLPSLYARERRRRSGRTDEN
jgi:hypothetical protein